MDYRLVEVRALPDFRLWVRFHDGTEGEVDLSDIAGRGVFSRWLDDPSEFERVSIDAVTGAPTWPVSSMLRPIDSMPRSKSQRRRRVGSKTRGTGPMTPTHALARVNIERFALDGPAAGGRFA